MVLAKDTLTIRGTYIVPFWVLGMCLGEFNTLQVNLIEYFGCLKISVLNFNFDLMGRGGVAERERAIEYIQDNFGRT